MVPSFQLDRGRFEEDLRRMCREDGVELILGAAVEDVDLADDGAPHRVRLRDGRTLCGRWVVDATGRRRMLARKLGLAEDSGHEAHAAWFRVEGNLEIGDLVPAHQRSWHGRDPSGIRWLSTSHLMGAGYWVWLIPLSTGYTSVGVVAHAELHPFESLNTLERVREWIGEHEPVLARRLEAHPVADFRSLRSYSHSATRVFSSARWACVGEAGVFVDPFYSPGSDFIALANSFVTELVRVDQQGGDLTEATEFFDYFYLRSAQIATLTYRDAAQTYGRPEVLGAKIYWDNFNYWSFLCPYFFQEIHRLPVEAQRPFVDVGQRFADLNARGQRLFAGWAARASGEAAHTTVVMPPVPSILANLHLGLEQAMSADETLAFMHAQADQAEELLGEILLRAVAALGPERGRELADEIGAAAWPLPGLGRRLDAERGERRGRRRRLPKLARDVERTLGRVDVCADVGPLADLARGRTAQAAVATDAQ